MTYCTNIIGSFFCLLKESFNIVTVFSLLGILGTSFFYIFRYFKILKVRLFFDILFVFQEFLVTLLVYTLFRFLDFYGMHFFMYYLHFRTFLILFFLLYHNWCLIFPVIWFLYCFMVSLFSSYLFYMDVFFAGDHYNIFFFWHLNIFAILLTVTFFLVHIKWRS